MRGAWLVVLSNWRSYRVIGLWCVF